MDGDFPADFLASRFREPELSAAWDEERDYPRVSPPVVARPYTGRLLPGAKYPNDCPAPARDSFRDAADNIPDVDPDGRKSLAVIRAQMLGLKLSDVAEVVLVGVQGSNLGDVLRNPQGIGRSIG